MIGPFIVLEHLGPAEFGPGSGYDAEPHPHIGIETLTFLIDGEIDYRDSLGTRQSLRPGDVGWMTAGAGIVHSERTPADARAAGGDLFGLRAWAALPVDKEETDPFFVHYEAKAIPRIEGEGIEFTLIAGASDGLVSPVRAHSNLVYADIVLTDGASYRVRADHAERAVYVVSGEAGVRGEEGSFGEGELIVLKPGAEIVLRTAPFHAARLVLIGGEPFAEHRHLYWNFVSSSAERIAKARDDWRANRFPAVPGERAHEGRCGLSRQRT